MRSESGPAKRGKGRGSRGRRLGREGLKGIGKKMIREGLRKGGEGLG